MSKENLKNLSVEQLQAKISENKNGLELLAKGGVSLPAVVKDLSDEIEAAQKELAGRQGEIFAKSVEPGVVKSVQKDFKGKSIESPITLQLTIFKDETTGEVTAKVEPIKRATRSASTGESTGSGNRGGVRMGARVETADGKIFEGSSASEVLKELKKAGVVKQEVGESDSAVRVLDGLQKRGQLKSFERVEIAKPEPKDEQSTEEAAQVENGTPAV